MMKSSFSANNYKIFSALVFSLFSTTFFAQQTQLPKAKTDAFWDNVQFGGGLGVGVGSGYTNITVAPSGIYNLNDYVSLGAGLQYGYLKQKDLYTSNIYGASLISLFNPVEMVQLSLEIEEVNVNSKYLDMAGDYKRNFWNTGLFIGAGFRQENLTIGGRFNVLYDRDKDIYGSAFMPFVRVFF